MLFGCQINNLILGSSTESDLVEAINDNPDLTDKGVERRLRKINRKQEANKAKAILADKNIDGLLMLVKDFDPLNCLKLLVDFLDYSRPFCLYSPMLQPLIVCYNELKRRKYACLKISESFFRKYQILPERSRPEMNTIYGSGFILSGIKTKID